MTRNSYKGTHSDRGGRVITPARAVELDLLGEVGDVTAVEIVLGAVEAASRHLKGTGCSVVVYPRNVRGETYGTGAHAGFVHEIDEDVLIGLGFTEDEILLAAGAEVATRLAGDGPVCDECDSYGERRSPKLRGKHARACQSCATMIREGWADRQLRTDVMAGEGGAP